MLKFRVFMLLLLSTCNADLEAKLDQNLGYRVDHVNTTLDKLSSATIDCETSNTTVKPLSCPSKGLHLMTLANGKNYYINATRRKIYDLIWNEAKEFCENLNMHVASPKTQTDFSNLHASLRDRYKHGNWWLSASDLGREVGDFRWHDGSSLVRNSPLWDNREPDDFIQGKGACVFITTYWRNVKLMDTPCNYANGIICQVPNECL